MRKGEELEDIYDVNLMSQFGEIVSLVNQLNNLVLENKFSIPSIVLFGSQNSGKSLVIQKILKLDFIPKGSELTRRPLEINMNYVLGLKQIYAQFDQVFQGQRKKRFTDFNRVKQTICEVTDKKCGYSNFKDEPIILNIFSENYPNMKILDLPGCSTWGLFQDPNKWFSMQKVLKYLKQPNSLIICVIPANLYQFSKSEHLKVLKQIDPKGERSIGCVSKIDLMDRGCDAINILKNRDVPLKFGYVGVKNPCGQDVRKGISIRDSLKDEVEYKESSWIYWGLPDHTWGRKSLIKRLGEMMILGIKKRMVVVWHQIKKRRDLLREQLQGYGCLDEKQWDECMLAKRRDFMRYEGIVEKCQERILMNREIVEMMQNYEEQKQEQKVEQKVEQIVCQQKQVDLVVDRVGLQSEKGRRQLIWNDLFGLNRR